jgi:hypothetical protein
MNDVEPLHYPEPQRYNEPPKYNQPQYNEPPTQMYDSRPPVNEDFD